MSFTANPYMERLNRQVAEAVEHKRRQRERGPQRKAKIDAAFEALDRLKEEVESTEATKVCGKEAAQKILEAKRAVLKLHQTREYEASKRVGVSLRQVCDGVMMDMCQQLSIPPIDERFSAGGRKVYSVDNRETTKKNFEVVACKRLWLMANILNGNARADCPQLPEWRQEMLEKAKSFESPDVKIIEDSLGGLICPSFANNK